MKSFITALLVVAVVLGAGYWYQESHSACKVPVRYSIGEVDDRFDMSQEEVREAVADAESLWEDVTGRNLFTYDPDGALTINFIFDDRQQLANDELELSELLDEKRGLSDSIRDEHNTLVAEYRKLEDVYKISLNAYEVRLGAYNNEVDYWNEQPSMPQDVYARLTKEQESLAAERQQLNRDARSINALVAEINELGQEGNETVRDYNDDVRDYNDRFNHEREFTQGDYQGDSINIYTFKDDLELRTVLAHELGHALHLGHVDDPQSIMYYLMEGQHSELILTNADLDEFNAICGDNARSGFLGFLDL